jgi:hypothetical protein
LGGLGESRSIALGEGDMAEVGIQPKYPIMAKTVFFYCLISGDMIGGSCWYNMYIYKYLNGDLLRWFNADWMPIESFIGIYSELMASF